MDRKTCNGRRGPPFTLEAAMSRTIKPGVTIVLDGVSMAWDGAGNRYYCLQSIVKARGNAKVAIVYVERGADYGTDLTGKEIMRVEEIVSHPHIKIRPDGQSAFVLGATREGKIHLSDDIPGWVGKP